MRKCLLAVLAVAWLLGGATMLPAPATAQTTVPINPQIAALLAQYPLGGPALRAAIARAVEADPSLAAAAVAAAAYGTPEQKAAIGAGLGDAVEYFMKIGADWARASEATIRTALVAADPITLAAYVSVVSTQGQPIPGTNNNAGNTTNGCISPSVPNGQGQQNQRC